MHLVFTKNVKSEQHQLILALLKSDPKAREQVLELAHAQSALFYNVETDENMY